MTSVVRLGMAALAALHGWWGLWAYGIPRHFFETFPGFGRSWTAAYPPLNEHLVADLGATFLTLAALLAVAAVLADRKVTAVVLAGVILFSTLHLAFHLRHHGTLTGADLAASLATLAAGVIVPTVLLYLSRTAAR